MKKDQEYQIRIHSPEHCEAVQNRLFQMGRKWASGDKTILNLEAQWIFLWSGNKIGFSSRTSDSYGHPIITLDDLYAPPFTGPKYITVPLNDSYSAEVSKEGISVSVNGVKQTDISYPLSVLDMLVEARGRLGGSGPGIPDGNFAVLIKSPEHSAAVQKRAFELGCMWSGRIRDVQHTDREVLWIEEYLSYGTKRYAMEENLPEFVTLDDLYGPKFTGVSEVEVKLAGPYSAKVSKDKLEVGCQVFPISVLDALLAARKEVTEG